MNKFSKVLLVSLAAFFLINLLFLDYFWFLSKDKVGQIDRVLKENFSVSLPSDSGGCAEACQEAISQKIREELAKETLSAGQSSVSPFFLPSPCPTQANVFQAKVLYMPLLSEGTTVSTAWTDIDPSVFYFDLSHYPDVKEVKFETHLMALHGSAKVYARLYDVSNKRGVDFSELETQSSSFARLESGGLAIWRGNNQYTIQLRSANGTEARLRDSRLKIIF